MFIGGKSPATYDTLPASPDDVPIFTQSRVDHFVVNFRTKWTLHESLPGTRLELGLIVEQLSGCYYDNMLMLLRNWALLF